MWCKGSGKEVKMQEFMYRDAASVELKCTVIPVMIGATGIVTRSLREHLEAVPGKHWIDSLQQAAVLGTAHIVREVLRCEGWRVSGGDQRWFRRSTGKERRMTGDTHIV
jgi:hypothetical protein